MQMLPLLSPQDGKGLPCLPAAPLSGRAAAHKPSWRQFEFPTTPNGPRSIIKSYGGRCRPATWWVAEEGNAGTSPLTPAVLLQGTPIVALLAELAVFALRVVQALHARPCSLVAGLRVSGVDVVVALAGLAGAADLVGAAEEARRTFITSTACLNKQARQELPARLTAP